MAATGCLVEEAVMEAKGLKLLGDVLVVAQAFVCLFLNELQIAFITSNLTLT